MSLSKSKYGGIPVEESVPASKYGGIPVLEGDIVKKKDGGIEQKVSYPNSSQSNIPLPSLSQQGFPTIEPTLLPTGNLTTNILPEAQKEEQRKTQQEYIKINNEKIAAFEKAANPFLNNKQSGLIAPETDAPVISNETPLQLTKLNHLTGVADVFTVNVNGENLNINSLDLPIETIARTSGNVNRYVNDLVTRLKDPKLNGTPQREADYKEIKGLNEKVQNATSNSIFSKEEQAQFVTEAAKYGINITEPFSDKWVEYAKQYRDAVQKNLAPKYTRAVGKENLDYLDQDKLKQDDAYLMADDIFKQVSSQTTTPAEAIANSSFIKNADQRTSYEKAVAFVSNGLNPTVGFVDEIVRNGLSLDKDNLGADFFMGLGFYKKYEPVTAATIEDMLRRGAPIPSALKNEITSKGLEIIDARNTNDYAEGRSTIENTLKNKEAIQKAYQENNLNRRDIVIARMGDGLSEYFDKKSQENPVNAYDPNSKLFGTSWMRTDKEIEEAAPFVAKELGYDINDIRVKNAVDFIKEREGFMLGQNGIKKDGLIRSLFRGASTPISGTVATIEGWGKTTDEKFAEAKNQGNAAFAEGRVQREKTGVLGVVHDAVDGLGQFITQAALMETGAGAFGMLGEAVGGISKVRQVANAVKISKGIAVEGKTGSTIGNAILRGNETMGIIATSYLQAYDSHLKDVMNMTSDESSAKGAAQLLSLLEGFSELILPDIKIGRQIIKNFSKETTNGILNILTKESLQKGLTNDAKKELISIVKDGVKKGSVNMLQEVSEEELVQWADFGVNAYLNPQQASDRNLAGETIETAVQTMVQMAIPVLGGIRGGVGNDAMRKGAIMVAAQNSGRLGEIINSKIANGEITQEQGNAQLQVINTAAAIHDALPTKFNGQKLNIEEKANYIFSRTREAVLNDRIKDEQDEVIVKEVKSEITKEQQIRRDILQGTPETNPSSVITPDRNPASDQSVISSTPASSVAEPVVVEKPTVTSLTSAQQESVTDALTEEEQIEYESAVENGTGEEFLLNKYNEINSATPTVTPSEDVVFIKELVDQKLIPSVDQSMVAPDGVFDQSKVEGYLQFVSDQTKDVGEEAMLNKGYPKQLIDLAVSAPSQNQTENATTTTAVNQSVESNTTGIQQGEGAAQVAAQEPVTANSDQGTGDAASVQLNTPESPALKEMGVEIKKDATSEGFYQVYKDGKFVGLLGATSFQQARNEGQYFDEGLMSEILSKLGIEHFKTERSVQGGNEFLTIRIKDTKAVDKAVSTQEIKDNTVQPSSEPKSVAASENISEVLVAPLYDTNIDNIQDAEALINSPVYKRYVENIKRVAEIMGLKVRSVTPNVGGYTHSTGVKVDELSNLVEIESGDLDAVTRFAAVMGVMTPETQDSTIAGQYLTDSEIGTENHTATRIEVTVDNIEESLRLAQESGLDYTFNITGKRLFFLDFGKGEDAEFSEKISTFANKLSENGIKQSTRYFPIRSNFITAEEGEYSIGRKTILEDIRRSVGYQQGGAEFRDLIDEAIQKNNLFIAEQRLSAERSEYAGLRDRQVALQESGQDLSASELQRMSDLIGVLTPSIKDTISSREEAYKEAKKEIETVGAKVSVGKGFVVPYGIKKVERATNKTLEWYNANPNRLGDGARTTIIVDNVMDADNIFNEIRSMYPASILRNESDNTDLGYPKRLLEVRTANGRIAEFQVMTTEGYLAKDGMADFPDGKKQEATSKLNSIQSVVGFKIPEGIGHWFYEVNRDNKVPKELRDKAKAISTVYYKMMLNPNSSNVSEEEFRKMLSEFKDSVEAADKSVWSDGNKAATPESVNKFLSSELSPKKSVDKKSKPVIGDKILWRDSEYTVTAVNKNGSFNANNGQLYVKEGVLSDKEYGGVVVDKPVEDIKSKGKKIADKIRKASIKSNVAQSNILGIPIAIYNAAVITVANAVELGATIAQAVDEAIKKHKLDSYEKFSKDKLVKYLESLSGIEPLTLAQRKLITSIELRRKKGMTDVQIKEDMLSVGKTEEQIDFAFNAGNIVLEAEAQREDRRNKNEILNAIETFLSSIGEVIIDQANFGLSGLSAVTDGMTSEAIDAIQNTEGDMQLSDTKLTTYLSGKTIEKTIGFIDDLSLLKTNDQVVAAMSLDQKANMLDYLILKAKSAFGEQDYLQKLLDMVSDNSLNESIRIDISVALDRHLQVLEGNPDTYYRAKWLREQNAAASQPVRRTVSLALNTLRLWDMAKHQAGALGMIVTQDMRNKLEETKAVMGMELSDEELVQSEDGTEDQINEEEQDEKPMTAVQKTKEFLFGSRGINEAKRKGKKIEKIDTVSKAYNFIKRIEERIKNCK